jgi:hypothetical protein
LKWFDDKIHGGFFKFHCEVLHFSFLKLYSFIMAEKCSQKVKIGVVSVGNVLTSSLEGVINRPEIGTI